jgi:hypothetical protein
MRTLRSSFASAVVSAAISASVRNPTTVLRPAPTMTIPIRRGHALAAWPNVVRLQPSRLRHVEAASANCEPDLTVALPGIGLRANG